MEFKQLLKKIAPTIDDVQNQPLYNESKTVQEIEVRTVRDLEDLFTLLKEEQIAIDFDDKNVFLSTYKIKVKISFEENVKVHGGLEKKYFYDKFLDFLRDDLNRVLVGFDLKNLAKELLSIHIALEKIRHLFSSNCFDIMIAHYLVTSDSKNDFEFLVDRYLEANERYENRLIQILKIKEKLLKEIKKAELGHIFKTIEMPLIPVLAHMELHGVKIDVAYLKTLSKLHADELLEIEKKIYELSGTSFNINSPKQLAHILFEKLKLPPITKIKTGFSTDAEVLQKLAFTHELPALILRYRELTKLKSTYIDALPTLVDSHSRVHAHFNQAVTATGRLSSSNPNLQNIPIKTEDGKKIRKAFVADQGYLLVGADYSQIELRIVAHLSKDEVLIDSFLKGEDIHRRTAAEIFMVDPKDVTDSMRATAKAINFGLIYGKTAFGLSQELNISKAEAQKYIDTYFNRYKGVKAFMNHAIEEARRTGEVVTMFGRKRVIKDINSKNFALRSNAERMAINTPMQGTAADIIKLAMIRVLENISKFNSKIILSVHDEIVLEVPQDKAKEQEKALKEIMENIVKLDVPLVANTGIADNWMDL
jgi:DNA polymerase-1